MGVVRLAGGPSNEIRAGEIKKMKLEREVSSGRGWEDIWLAAEREMAHWQVAPVLKLELDSFKQRSCRFVACRFGAWLVITK